MRLADLPAAIDAVTAALPGWHHLVPEPVSTIHDHIWLRGDEKVTLSTWPSASTVHTQITYGYAGMETASLVLTDVAQIRPWLTVVGVALVAVLAAEQMAAKAALVAS